MLIDGYPGIYLQEVPSGVRTIVAASTSTLALVAHFPRGPVGDPRKVTSWEDVLRTYGGLDRRYVGLEALRDFFAQGGSYAWVTRVAFERPTLVLQGVDVAFTVEAKATGTPANGFKISIAEGADGSFSMTIDDTANPPVTISDLSADPASPRFVERIVNASSAEGGSDLVRVRNTRFAPAPLAPASAAVLAGGGSSARASANIPSVEFPALTLQGLAGWTPGTRVTAVPGTTAGFKLTFSGLSGANVDLDNLTLAPGAGFVVDQVAGVHEGGKPLAAVVIGRNPLRQPINLAGAAPAAIGNNATVAASAAGQPARASRNILRPLGTGPGNAMQVRAISPGDWGNNLRIGIAASTSGFDLVITEYRGSEVVTRETYRNLSTVATDSQYGRTVVNEQSRLIEITSLTTAPRLSAAGVSADDLQFGQMLPLAGGGDGTLPGEPAWADNAADVFNGITDATQGIGSFDRIKPNLINLMAIPEAPMMSDRGFATYARAGEYCRDALAFLLVDHPSGNDSLDTIANWDIAGRLGSDLARSAAICFPRLRRENRTVQASGAIAGLMARTDAQRGVWKAPAGLDASLSGALPSVLMTDRQQAGLNKSGINCLRVKPGAGTVQWGARTLAGADILASEWKYVPVRRTALMIEQTLRDALAWVVFEPNDTSLWAQIRLNVGAFLQSLFVQGAFQGTTPREAYLVKCDAETTSQQDVNSGIVNILCGFAPLKPTEFVVLRLTQLAGRLAN